MKRKSTSSPPRSDDDKTQDAINTRNSFLRSLFNQPGSQSGPDDRPQSSQYASSHINVSPSDLNVPFVPQMHLAESTMVPLHALPQDTAQYQQYHDFQNASFPYHQRTAYQMFPTTDQHNQGFEIVTPDTKWKEKSSQPTDTNLKQYVASPEIVCNCVKSRCLKLYCDCFQRGILCNTFCKCNHCLNIESQSFDGGALFKAKAEYMSRKPEAFGKKKKKTGQGCSCRNNRCLKKYCACFREAISCSDMCSCIKCANVSARPKEK